MRHTLFASAALLAAAFAVSACVQAGEGPSTTAYLEQARQAVRLRDSGQALAALDRAETSVIQTAGPPSENHQWAGLPAARAVTEARQAVAREDWPLADRAIDDAASNVSTLGV